MDSDLKYLLRMMYLDILPLTNMQKSLRVWPDDALLSGCMFGLHHLMPTTYIFFLDPQYHISSAPLLFLWRMDINLFDIIYNSRYSLPIGLLDRPLCA
jgi:hypothetical protein